MTREVQKVRVGVNLEDEEHPVWIEVLPAQEGDERMVLSLEAASTIAATLKTAIGDVRVVDKPTEFIRVGQ